MLSRSGPLLDRRDPDAKIASLMPARLRPLIVIVRKDKQAGAEHPTDRHRMSHYFPMPPIDPGAAAQCQELARSVATSLMSVSFARLRTTIQSNMAASLMSLPSCEDGSTIPMVETFRKGDPVSASASPYRFLNQVIARSGR